MVPMVIGSRVIEVSIAPDIINEEFDYVLSDQAIYQRIEWTIHALFGKNITKHRNRKIKKWPFLANFKERNK